MKLTIAQKLVLATMSITAFVVCLIAALTQYSVTAGFADYVARRELADIDSLAPLLERAYAQHGHNWNFAKEDNGEVWKLIELNERIHSPRTPTDVPDEFPEGLPGTAPIPRSGKPPPPSSARHADTDWHDERKSTSHVLTTNSAQLPDLAVTAETPAVTQATPLEGAGEHPGNSAQKVQRRPSNSAGNLVPFPPHRMDLFQRLAVFDANGALVWGNAEAASEPSSVPLVVNNVIIGKLSLASDDFLPVQMDRDFVALQHRNLLVVSVVAITLAAIAASVLASSILKPVRMLARAVRKLSGGDFLYRVPVDRSDELGQLARDFNSLGESLEQYDRAHRQWMADSSHELRTPIAVLRAQVEALQDGVHEMTPKTLAAIHDEIMTMTRLVDDLHELAKSDVGQLRYERVPVDIAGVLLDAVDSTRERFAAKNIELVCDVAPCVVRADPDRLRQLFLNLLENSRRYTDSGGTLQVSGVKEETGGGALITFDDSPPGVSAELLPHIFERFVRGDTSRSRTVGGTGLGLAICKTIVDAHDGKMTAAASKRGGLRIEVLLPPDGVKNA